MIFEIIIPPGAMERITNIIDREGELCSNITKLTNRMGDLVSDERTGPECDEVHEGEIS